ncbi:hypothetical protein AAT19DRAFT_14141 [Rhodotorula toruloides]|uniref:Uncharacterized protein n=1 Tax=Rhodotorula toruloides TaxID=5286 RepID=A0A2T0AAV6_RHOTO|nr:hypothetical protein AAT19DRAFT_14141 [Rhodotorula toruloides]
MSVNARYAHALEQQQASNERNSRREIPQRHLFALPISSLTRPRLLRRPFALHPSQRRRTHALRRRRHPKRLQHGHRQGIQSRLCTSCARSASASRDDRWSSSWLRNELEERRSSPSHSSRSTSEQVERQSSSSLFAVVVRVKVSRIVCARFVCRDLRERSLRQRRLDTVGRRGPLRSWGSRCPRVRTRGRSSGSSCSQRARMTRAKEVNERERSRVNLAQGCWE